MRDMANFSAANGVNGKSSPSRGLNDHINFSSGQPLAPRYMPQIPENGNESTNLANVNLVNGQSGNEFYLPSFQNDSWNESSLSGVKRTRESDDKFSGCNAMDSQVVPGK